MAGTSIRILRKTAWRLMGLDGASRHRCTCRERHGSAVHSVLGRRSAQREAAPVVTECRAPILQDKCQAWPSPGYIAPMAFVTYEETRPWARSIRRVCGAADAAMAHRQDRRHSALQERSVAHRRADRDDRQMGRCGRAEGRSEGHAAAEKWPNDNGWNFASSSAGRRTRSSSRRRTRCRRRRRTSGTSPWSTTGLTEPRWVRAIEIRPATVKGRRITHHALARLLQDEPTITGQRRSPVPTTPRRRSVHGMGRRQAGEIMRPNSGKLMLPGSKIMLGRPLHAVGEEITDQVELGIYFYPKGQEPKYPHRCSRSFSGIAGGNARTSTSRPNRSRRDARAST